MKIFLDTANLDAIQQWLETGLIDGITTNPSHLSKEGGNPTKHIHEICSLMKDGEVSVEVTETDPHDVYRQAKEIAALADNIIVKIPCHKNYYSTIKRLAAENIKLNITLVFTLLQGIMMCKLGAYYISPFVGRWDDIDCEGIKVIRELTEAANYYNFDTQVLAASLRHVRHFHHAITYGADIVTLPLNVLEEATTHPLTDQGIKKFNTDWQKLNITKFP